MRPPRPACSAITLAALAAVFIVLADNRRFWSALFAIVAPDTVHGALLEVSAFLILAGSLTVLFLLFSANRLFKPVLAAAVILSAVIGYFGSAYGVVIDGAMVRNILATDRREAVELLTAPLAVHLLVYGALPALAIILVRVTAGSVRSRAVAAGAAFLCVVSVAGLNYRSLTLIGREHKELRLTINPLYAVYAAVKYGRAAENAPVVVEPVGTDAREAAPAGRKRTVVVLVVGETAREKEFSLNGYERRTNPFLEQDGVVSFTQAYACGTSTAESLPCMFSHLDRSEYSARRAAAQENVLDVLSRAGVNVLWRDNNSGCKGVCERVITEDLAHLDVSGLCDGGECYDEVLLNELEERIEWFRGDLLITLHQKGSHGPAYHRRHPDRFSVFVPECRSDAPQDCTNAEIVNAYDNTILYTDYFLHRTIELLKERSRTEDTMMVYFSDHGESLGEQGLYLHGIPYLMAPDEQTHVPFIVWMSDGYAAGHGVDRGCLQHRSSEPSSHANLFHSLLGAFQVRTSVYDQDRDVFARCRESGPVLSRPHQPPASSRREGAGGA